MEGVHVVCVCVGGGEGGHGKTLLVIYLLVGTLF